MADEIPSRTAQSGDLALLVARDQKTLLIRLEPGVEQHTHHGVLRHDDLIGAPWGASPVTHTGYPYVLLRPSTDDIVRDLRRTTQIVYPKDAGYILMKMGIGPGCRVIEAGSGSGAMAIMLARAVRPAGRVYSYDVRSDVQNLARKNLERLGLADVVELKLRDIAEGFDEQGADALFYDLPNPWQYLDQAHRALMGGGFFSCILPTTNQVIELLDVLEVRHFGLIEVEELFVRPWKPVPGRLRPMDRMVAHTGYLVFARALAAGAVPPVAPVLEPEAIPEGIEI